MNDTATKGRRRWPRIFVRVVVGLFLVVSASAFVCRATIGWFYPVTSGSMEPTIMTGEWVFLQYSKRTPERYEIWAFTDTGGGASLKRAMGLPGETVLINRAGDLRISEKMLPDSPDRPALVPIFDSRLQSIGDHWTHGVGGFDPWQRTSSKPNEGEVWRLDASPVRRGATAGLLRLHDRVTDGRLDDEGVYHVGRNVVHDVAVEFEARVIDVGGALVVQLTEQNDLFEARVQVYAGQKQPNLYIQRQRRALNAPANGERQASPFLAAGIARIDARDWFRVRFANIDNRLSFQIGDDPPVVVPYDRNAECLDPDTGRITSPGERVRIGAEGLVLEIRDLRVLRDRHIVPRGTYGVNRPLNVGDAEVYMLGDASEKSSDSRDRGPVPVNRLIGRARAVVWPPSSWRMLR